MSHQTALACPVPAGLAPGRYELALGVVQPTSRQPSVRLAISGRDPDGWYPVSDLEIVQ